MRCLFLRADKLNISVISSSAITWHELANAPYAPGRYTDDNLREFARLDQEAFDQVSGVLALGRHVVDDLRVHYGLAEEKLAVVGSGFSIPPYHGPKDYERGPVLFVAKLRWQQKGGDLLIDAFRLARAQRPELELIVVGQDEHVRRLRNEPGVRAFGHVSFAELCDLFARARLFAMPALCEPWGLVYLEALAARTPTLGLNRLAFPELSGGGRFGFGVDEPTPAAVADGLLDATSDAARLSAMGWAGQRYVEGSYGWDRMADAALELLDRAHHG